LVDRQSDIRVVSNLLILLISKHFIGASGSLELEGFEDAFEMFTNGELRLRLPESRCLTTQPSSGLFFFFAEFALLCTAAGIETELWTRLAGR